MTGEIGRCCDPSRVVDIVWLLFRWCARVGSLTHRLIALKPPASGRKANTPDGAMPRREDERSFLVTTRHAGSTVKDEEVAQNFYAWMPGNFCGRNPSDARCRCDSDSPGGRDITHRCDSGGYVFRGAYDYRNSHLGHRRVLAYLVTGEPYVRSSINALPRVVRQLR